MPTVELPDGTQIEFPEGTDQATINKASADTWAKIKGGAGPVASAPVDRFAGKSLDDLKKYYQQRQAAGGKPEELASLADQYVKKEHDEGGFGLAVDDTLRQVAKGVPILGGSLDELAAGASSLMGGNYDEALDYQRARDRFMEKGAPVLSTGLQLAGGIGGTIAGMGALGMGGAGVNSSIPLAQRAAAGVAVGLPVGAADAFARAEGGVENRAQNSVLGGILGGVTGGAAPFIGQGLSSAYQNVKNFLTPNASFRALGVSRPVGEELVDLMGADAGKRGLARIRAAGPDAMIADAGPNAQGIADAVIAKKGPGASYIGRAIEDRAKKASKGLVSTLDDVLGAPEGKAAQITAIRESTAGARGQAYDDAYDAIIDYDAPAGQEIAALWSRVRAPRRAAANALLEEAGLPPIADGQLPTVRQIDYVTRALNDVAQSGEGQGALGGVNQVGRSAQDLSRKLRDATRAAAPEYAKALDTAADPISRIEGVKLGTKLLNPQFTRAELKDALDGMTGPERQAVVSGIRAQLDETVANIRGTASDPNMDARQLNEMVRQLTSKATREKIGIVLDDPKKTMKFFREIGQAFKAAELRAGVATNSKTATRMQAIGGIDERLQPGVVGTAMEGNLPGATKRAIQVATGATPRQQRLRNNEQWLELARLLSEKRGREAEDLLRKLMAASKSRAASSATGKGIGAVGAGTVAGANPLLVEGVN